MAHRFSFGVDRVIIDGNDFAKLVRGEVVKLSTVRHHVFELALQDIGWEIMREYIDAAEVKGREDEGSGVT